jgi:hypothetical protein
VVRAHTDLAACHDLGAALTDDDLAGRDFLTVGALEAEVLRIGIVKIFRCSACLGCCHSGILVRVNGVTIQAFWLRCKALAEEGIGQFGLILLVFLTASAAFGLGRLSALETVPPPISIQQAPESEQALALAPGGYVVASKSGSVYYLPWCAGAEKMASDKQVWFSSEAAAQKAGYAPSKSCKGLLQ